MSLPLLQHDYLCGLGMEHQEQQTFAKETTKKELQFFRIINLQKIKVRICIDGADRALSSYRSA